MSLMSLLFIAHENDRKREEPTPMPSRILRIARAAGLLASLSIALAACSPDPAPVNPSKDGGPEDAGPKEVDGVWETDTSPVMKLQIINGPPTSYLEARRQPDGKREIWHFEGGGEPIRADFMPPGFLLYAQGVFKDGETVICGVSGPSLNVATSNYTGVASTCGVRKGSGFAPIVTTGTWIKYVCSDADAKSRVSVLYLDKDQAYEFSNDPGPKCQRVTYDGSAWSAPSADHCYCERRIGQPCEDLCFQGKGQVAASGRCEMPAGATPTCPAGSVCTGTPGQLCMTQQ